MSRSKRSMRRRDAVALAFVAACVAAQTWARRRPRRRSTRNTRADQAVPAGSAHHDRAGRSPAGVATVPSPLKFLGRIVGTPGELTYAKDIHRYYEALAKAAPTRAKYWKIGTTEEGRDIVAARDRRRSDDREPRQVQGRRSASSPIRARRPRRSAQQLHHDGEADLLDHERHALAGEPAAPRC